MNICLASQEYPPETAHGGIGTQTWNKARWLSRLGHTVHVVTCAPAPCSQVAVEDQDGVTVHRLPPPGEEADREMPLTEPSIYWLGYSWTLAQYLHQITRRVPFDVLDFPDYGGEAFAYLLTRATPASTPVAIQLHGGLAMCSAHHGWPTPHSEFYRVGTLMEDICLKRADALMACSANIAGFAARYHGIARDAAAIVYCGVDCDLFRPAARTRRDRPTVLFVGDVSAKKGAHIVFEAVLRLRARIPDIRLQMVGKTEDELAAELQARSCADGTRGAVEFVGFVDHARLRELYQQADVFASPADHELGVANVYLEAMASGCPVVACNSGGAAEAIVHEETGLLVPANDVASTTVAIDRIVSDRTLRERLGRAGRQRAEAHFAMDRYIARVIEVYGGAITAARQQAARQPTITGACLSESLS